MITAIHFWLGPLRKKYFPTCSLREYQPKPHHSWVWRNITETKCSSLHHGRWLIGNGSQIPLSHPDWIQCLNHVLREYGLHNCTVADLGYVWIGRLLKTFAFAFLKGVGPSYSGNKKTLKTSMLK